jgi:peptide-methionine (S)-S-oxide reductase
MVKASQSFPQGIGMAKMHGMANAIITLGGGCFWCTEAVYVRVRGVLDVESGYSNGLSPNRPTYEQVCTGRTGCNEVVRLTYDNSVITLHNILDIFFEIHDPTSLNRQGNDVGTQYRSAIYVSNDADHMAAVQFISEVTSRGEFDNPIVTEVLPLQHYWPAEDYHQDYFEHNPFQGYCTFVVAPKVKKLHQHFAEWVKN